MRAIGWAAAAMTMAAPATGGGGAARPAPVETIRYETSACFGFCPAYAVTVSSDGRGTFDGRGHTAVRGVRAFAVTPAQFAAFRAALKKVRPNGEVLIQPGQPLCGAAATDQITIDVRWQRAGEPDRHLSLYFGCANTSRDDLRGPLVAAPRALPIAAFIGKPAPAR